VSSVHWWRSGRRGTALCSKAFTRHILAGYGVIASGKTMAVTSSRLLPKINEKRSNTHMPLQSPALVGTRTVMWMCAWDTDDWECSGSTDRADAMSSALPSIAPRADMQFQNSIPCERGAYSNQFDGWATHHHTCPGSLCQLYVPRRLGFTVLHQHDPAPAFQSLFACEVRHI
jgi:hypothetical protein